MNSKIDSIERELVFDAPVERVWSAICTPEEVKCWFGSDARFELVEGGDGYFGWDNECEGKYAMRIETIRTNQYLAWRWMTEADIAFELEGSTLVEWTLSPTTEGGTRLILIESGFLTNRLRDMNIEGWLYELYDLASYLKQ